MTKLSRNQCQFLVILNGALLLAGFIPAILYASHTTQDWNGAMQFTAILAVPLYVAARFGYRLSTNLLKPKGRNL